MYSIVEFLKNERNIIAVILRKWITVTPDGMFVAWPPYDDKYTFSKAVIKHYSPLPSWKVYAVRKVHYETGML